MIFSDNRNQLRQSFFDAWQKHLNKQVLQPLESQIVDVLLLHPEYQDIMTNPEKYHDKDFLPDAGETNPFLHLSLHLAVIEQMTTNRPKGINKLYQALLQKLGNTHDAQHAILEVLAESLWIAQRNNQAPDEKAYLKNLKKLLKR